MSSIVKKRSCSLRPWSPLRVSQTRKVHSRISMASSKEEIFMPKASKARERRTVFECVFQAIEYGTATDGEFLFASLTEKILDVFIFAM
jgi:hypothetical protein